MLLWLRCEPQMWILHDVWGAGNLGSTLSQKQEVEPHRPPAESTSLCGARDQNPGSPAHSCALSPGLFYPRLRPCSTTLLQELIVSWWAPEPAAGRTWKSREICEAAAGRGASLPAFISSSGSLLAAQISYFPHPAWNHNDAVSCVKLNS